jgi:phosphoglycolate phosphatase
VEPLLSSYNRRVVDARPPLVVGFDLDMTLIDPRRSIRSALDALSEESGVAIDAELVLSTLGPPLEMALAPWFDGVALERACRRFRQIHEPILVDQTEPMPGAIEAVGAVRGLGGKAVVVTAKYEPHARTSLQAVGIVADAVVGWRYGPEKGEALRDHGAQVYVGDHPADVLAAKVGDSVAVAVATGGTSGPELRRAGADVVLPDLFAFPSWLERWMAARGGNG